MAEVGLALAIFPLLISAMEHYEDAATTFNRYRHFASEAANLASILRIQRTIFRAANKSLLDRVVGKDDADIMLGDAQHAFWSDKIAEQGFIQQLGDFGDAVIESIRLIKDKLESLEEESRGFEDAKSLGKEVGNSAHIQNRERSNCDMTQSLWLRPHSYLAPWR